MLDKQDYITKLQEELLCNKENFSMDDVYNQFEKCKRQTKRSPLNIPALVSMLSGGQETNWQLSRIQEISPV